jgi:SET domain-containing protein
LTGWRPDLVEVRPSKIHGLGIFAANTIPAGTHWWSIDIGETIAISRTQFALLSQSASTAATDAMLAGIQTYSIYLEAFDLMVLIPDNGRFVNHSDVPNSAAGVDGRALYSVALRDIAAGEEITEDYSTYDVCPWPGVSEEFHEAQTPTLAALIG